MLALLFVVLQAVAVTDLASPRPSGWVVDHANQLDAATEARLDELAEQLYRAKGIELAVVVIHDSQGTPKQFATALFNHWGIGAAATSTGVLVLLVMRQRRLEIETGTRIEAALPSAWLAAMQAREMVPRFKQGDFGAGLVAGVGAISAHLRAAPGESASTESPGEYRSDGTIVAPGDPFDPVHAPPPRPMPASSTPSEPPEDGGSSTGGLIAGGLGLLGIGGGGAALLARHRRRQRTCTTCQPPRRMLALDELADDAHLDAGQQTEERLRSVDYEVVVCPGCQASRTLRHNKWFSGFSRCSSCSYKTMSSSSRTILHATYDHGGQVEVTEDCRHCDHSHTYTRSTPRRTRPSTSSSSSSGASSFGGGSSGFGGGSSSGGGAGSSW